MVNGVDVGLLSRVLGAEGLGRARGSVGCFDLLGAGVDFYYLVVVSLSS